MATRTTTPRRIATFVVIVAGLSAILDALLINAGTIDAAGGLYAFITMWVPAVAALVTCRIHREPIRSLGWHPGKPRYLALAYLLPVAYATVACLPSRGQSSADPSGRCALERRDLPTWALVRMSGDMMMAFHSGSLTLREHLSRRRFVEEALHASFFGRRAIQRREVPFARS